MLHCQFVGWANTHLQELKHVKATNHAPVFTFSTTYHLPAWVWTHQGTSRIYPCAAWSWKNLGLVISRSTLQSLQYCSMDGSGKLVRHSGVPVNSRCPRCLQQGRLFYLWGPRSPSALGCCTSRGVQKKFSDLPARKGCNGDANGDGWAVCISKLWYDGKMVVGRGMEAASLLPPASSQRGLSAVHGPCLRKSCDLCTGEPSDHHWLSIHQTHDVLKGYSGTFWNIGVSMCFMHFHGVCSGSLCKPSGVPTNSKARLDPAWKMSLDRQTLLIGSKFRFGLNPAMLESTFSITW